MFQLLFDTVYVSVLLLSLVLLILLIRHLSNWWRAVSSVKHIPGVDFFSVYTSVLFHRQENLYTATPDEIIKQCKTYTREDEGKCDHVGAWRVTMGEQIFIMTAYVDITR